MQKEESAGLTNCRRKFIFPPAPRTKVGPAPREPSGSHDPWPFPLPCLHFRERTVSRVGFLAVGGLTHGGFPVTEKSARRIPAFVLLTLLSTVGVQAEDGPSATTEEWRCFSPFDLREKKVLVWLTREIRSGVDLGFGEVSVAGVTHDARFEVAGIDRRWDFGGDMQYAFIIHPNGSGAYYDFSTVKDGGRTGPSQQFRCEPLQDRGHSTE